MDKAAAIGHLATVKWLHSNRSEGCRTKAMDMAACNSHTYVILWFHRHRSEGCSINAMDDAATAGNLVMIKWLHANRSEGCSARAVVLAACIGRLDITQYLNEQVGKSCTTTVLTNAAIHGHLPILRWGWQWEDAWAVYSMDTLRDVVINGHRDVAKFLVLERGVYNNNEEVFEAVAKIGHFAVLEWLVQNHVDTSVYRIGSIYITAPLNYDDLLLKSNRSLR